MQLKATLRLALAPLLMLSSFAYAEWGLNMTQGVTEVSRNIYDLHMLIFYICVAIGIGVFGVMFYSIYAHRKSKGFKPAKFHDSLTVEIIWTIIPFFILGGMAIPATTTLIDMYDTSEAHMDIKITGYQWKWQYEYLEEDISFFSNLRTAQEEINNELPKGEHYLLEVDEPIVIPVGKKIRFLITSADVIHSWWVPALAVKKDAIPGFINESWAIAEETGIYRGQCAELCGKDHGFMPIVVRVVEQDEYDAWIAEKQVIAAREKELFGKEWSQQELMAKGEQVYQSSCAGCHQADGSGLPPTFPALKGSPVATGPIEDHIAIVLGGKNMMPSFGPQLNEVDIAAVVTYERNAWGNNMGDMATPRQVADIKGQ